MVSYEVHVPLHLVASHDKQQVLGTNMYSNQGHQGKHTKSTMEDRNNSVDVSLISIPIFF
jgi:hypothetical protein